MKHQKSIKILAVILAVAAGLVIAVSAAYDSSEDPLVSLSYLRNIFKQEMLDSLKNEIDAAVEERVQEITDGAVPAETEAPAETTEPTEPTEPTESASSGFEVLELHAGQQLYALDACEIMLRSGSAVCIAPDPTQGIADYTTAVEIYNAESLTKNHMCLIPRGDGRGLLVLSEVSYIMVRGEYSIVGE